MLQAGAASFACYCTGQAEPWGETVALVFPVMVVGSDKSTGTSPASSETLTFLVLYRLL